jgi:hypothetical protein
MHFTHYFDGHDGRKYGWKTDCRGLLWCLRYPDRATIARFQQPRTVHGPVADIMLYTGADHMQMLLVATALMMHERIVDGRVNTIYHPPPRHHGHSHARSGRRR